MFRIDNLFFACRKFEEIKGVSAGWVPSAPQHPFGTHGCYDTHTYLELDWKLRR